MQITLRRQPPTATVNAIRPARKSAEATPALKIELYASPSEIEPLWRAFETTAVTSGFQSYRWLSAWCRHVAPHRNEQPLIVVGRLPDGNIDFIWPLSTTRRAGATVLGWLGQSHNGYNMGLYAPGIAERLTRTDIEGALRVIRAARPEISAVAMTAQPVAWNGVPNPFAALPHQRAPNHSWCLALPADFDTLFTSCLSKHARHAVKRRDRDFAAIDDIRHNGGSTAESRWQILESFFVQKQRQFAELGIHDVFADPGMRDFYRDLAAGDASERALFGCSALVHGEETLATACGITFQDRYYLLTLSMSAGKLARLSPGLKLLKDDIAANCGHGVAHYDFGCGDGQHKSMWRPTAEPLFDTYLALSFGGRVVTSLSAAASRAKRAVKQNPTAFALAKRLRGLLRGQRSQPVAAALRR
jgi:CelD/BcsL family acetyltransferase involved in cellulose biosynthesis